MKPLVSPGYKEMPTPKVITFYPSLGARGSHAGFLKSEEKKWKKRALKRKKGREKCYSAESIGAKTQLGVFALVPFTDFKNIFS